MSQVLASAEAREQLPRLIDTLVAHPEERVEIGRQRRREVVLVAAERFDDLLAREEAVRDLAWAVFAADRVANPTSEPIPLDQARRMRRQEA
jgi:hypothetical protein